MYPLCIPGRSCCLYHATLVDAVRLLTSDVTNSPKSRHQWEEPKGYLSTVQDTCVGPLFARLVWSLGLSGQTAVHDARCEFGYFCGKSCRSRPVLAGKKWSALCGSPLAAWPRTALLGEFDSLLPRSIKFRGDNSVQRHRPSCVEPTTPGRPRGFSQATREFGSPHTFGKYVHGRIVWTLGSLHRIEIRTYVVLHYC